MKCNVNKNLTMNTYARIEMDASLERVALVFEGRQFSYRELFELVNRTAEYLRIQDVGNNDRVVILLPNIPEFVILYLACLKIGAVPVSAGIALTSVEIEKVLRDSKFKIAFTEQELAPKLQEASQSLNQQVHVFGQNLELDSLPPLSIGDASAETVSKEDDDRAAILYTSGTTGSPKGVVLTHGNLNFHSAAVIKNTPIGQDDKSLLFLPLFHCFGQNYILNANLQAGATVVLLKRYDFDTIRELVKKQLVTLFFAVPTVYYRILDAKIAPETLASVRYFFSAAAPLKENLARAWHATFGHPIHQGYGLTESSPLATYNAIPASKPKSIGRPIEGVSIRLQDESGAEVGPGELGEFVIKGPNVMQGYFNWEAETALVLKDGWLRTGDVGMYDEDGDYYILQRKKEMINVAGFKVLPSEVEVVVLKHDQIDDVAVFSLPDPERGEVVAALVVSNNGELNEAGLKIYLAQFLAKYKVPERVFFTEKIERTDTGKLNQAKLSELYSSEKSTMA